MISKKIFDYYFFVLFSIIPISILVGPAISLMTILLLVFGTIIIFSNKDYSFLMKEKTVLLLLAFYAYLILNSFISIDFETSFKRNFGFIRYIILFISVNYLFLKLGSFNNIFKFWLLIFVILLGDVLFEFYFGKNILGFESENPKRIVSFFKDEEIVGTFLNGFFFILIGFLLLNFENKSNLKKILILSFVILTTICIIITGERSNTLKLFFGLLILFFLSKQIKLNYKIFFIISLASIIFIASNLFLTTQQKNNLKHRYYNDMIERLVNKEKRNNYIYFKLYESGFQMFKNHSFFGVGNKNYRIESCQKKIDENQMKYVCNTHPHQIYFELLSEHGFFGTLVILSIIFYLIFKNYKKMIIKKNILQISCFAYLLTYFIPILPGGSFFADFNANLFWITFSIYYASDMDTNIFKNN